MVDRERKKRAVSFFFKFVKLNVVKVMLLKRYLLLLQFVTQKYNVDVIFVKD